MTESGMRLINKTLLIVLLLIPCQTHAFDRYNRVQKYDKYFSKYSKRYFGPAFDWRYFKAQAVAESPLEGLSHEVGVIVRASLGVHPHLYGQLQAAPSNSHSHVIVSMSLLQVVSVDRRAAEAVPAARRRPQPPKGRP